MEKIKPNRKKSSSLSASYSKEILAFLEAHVDLNFFIISKDGQYLFNSSKLEKILAGENRADFFDIESWKDCMDTMESGETKILEEKYKGKNKNYVGHWFLSFKSPFIRKNKIEGIMGISIDITDRKKMEQKILQTNQKLQNVLNAIPGHVYWKDKEGRYLGCNSLQSKNMRAQEKDILGKTDYDFFPKQIADRIRKIDLKVLQNSAPITLEEKGPLVGSEEEHIFLSRKVPLYNPENMKEVIGLLGVSIDITEKKRTEQELLETRHKLAGMTILGASIAHELRTPLASIKIGLDNIKEDLPVLIEGYELANKKTIKNPLRSYSIKFLNESIVLMEQEINLANLVINVLLENINPSIPFKQKEAPFQVASCIEDALNRYPFKKHQKELIRFECKFDFLLEGKELLLTHILFNLIKNALYYIAQAGKGEIMIWLEEGRKYNTLYFKDTGRGIHKEDLPHIFTPFFSKRNEGSGMGLSYCKKMIEDYFHGKISCNSKEGEYALFIIKLPRIK